MIRSARSLIADELTCIESKEVDRIDQDEGKSWHMLSDWDNLRWYR